MIVFTKAYVGMGEQYSIPLLQRQCSRQHSCQLLSQATEDTWLAGSLVFACYSVVLNGSLAYTAGRLSNHVENHPVDAYFMWLSALQVICSQLTIWRIIKLLCVFSVNSFSTSKALSLAHRPPLALAIADPSLDRASGALDIGQVQPWLRSGSESS